MRKLIMAGALALSAAALCSCSSPQTGNASQGVQTLAQSANPTTTVPPGPVIALNPQDQAFVDGLKAHGLDANNATPNLARSDCQMQESLNNVTGTIGSITGHRVDEPQEAPIAWNGLLQQAEIFYKDPDQAKLFAESAIETYCDDLAWIEPLP